jgi:hypothetical protein
VNDPPAVGAGADPQIEDSRLGTLPGKRRRVESRFRHACNALLFGGDYPVAYAGCEARPPRAPRTPYSN